MKAKSGRKLYGFLCSDILVLTDESMKTLYRMVRQSLLSSLPVLTPTLNSPSLSRRLAPRRSTQEKVRRGTATLSALIDVGGEDDLIFQVTQAYPRGGDAIALKATSVRDCQGKLSFVKPEVPK